MVGNYQNADCSFRRKNIVSFMIIFGTRFVPCYYATNLQHVVGFRLEVVLQQIRNIWTCRRRLLASTSRRVQNKFVTNRSIAEFWQCHIRNRQWTFEQQLNAPWICPIEQVDLMRRLATPLAIDDTPLRELTYHTGSHSVTCHPTEVTFPPLPQPKLVLLMTQSLHIVSNIFTSLRQ